MKRIITFFKLDMKLAQRDSVAVYSLVSPIMLAVIMRLIIPTVQDVSVTLAVSRSVEPVIIARLQNYGDIELFEREEDIVARVNENDSVAGILYRDRQYEIVLEGNEGAESGEGVAALIADATGKMDDVSFTVKDLKGDPVPVKEYGAAMLAMLSLFVGGIIVGFNIVEEKEGGVTRALAVSPLRILEYISARSILALIIGCISGFSTVLILLGWNIDYPMYVLALFVSMFVALPFGFIIGALADNQMTAFALVKLLMAAFLTLPFISIFVPMNWQWVFYILPNYWMFLSLNNALVGTAHVGMPLTAVLTVLTGIAMIGLLYPKLRSGLRIR